MSTLHGVVVGHGDLARAMVASVEEISGVRGVLTAVTNTGCDRGSLEARIAAAIEGRPAVVFVDLASGSCLFAAVRRTASDADVRVVTGVNLAMLLDFVFHREDTPDAAVTRALESGTRAIAQRR